MKYTYRSLVALLLAIVGATASASEQEAANALKDFEGRVLVLRHPLQDSFQQYDAEGKALKSGDEGPWTVYGGVLVDRVRLSPDKLRFEGRRVLFLFLKGQFTAMEFKRLKRPVDPPFPPAVQLEVALVCPLDSAEEARTILGRVFALDTKGLLDSLPEFWRGPLDDELVYDPSQKREAEFRMELPPYPKRARKAAPNVITSDQIFHVGSEVTAPKATFTPEPKFTEIARYQKFQGILVVNLIVGRDGTVHQIRLVRPLGLGLDESAQAMIQTWRFQPSMRNGEPVAVEMNVEVAFNLY
jgi:TonB family protein